MMLARMSDRDLIHGSVGIVAVTVLRVRARSLLGFPRHEGTIGIRFWDHAVQVNEVLKSRNPLPEHMLIRTVRADSEARFWPGENALVFLGPSDAGALDFSVEFQDEDFSQVQQVFRVFGGFQGKLTIEGEAEPSLSRPGQPRMGLDRFRRALAEVAAPAKRQEENWEKAEPLRYESAES